MHVDDRRELEELDLKLRVLLPETYQDSYDKIEPAPMGSAALKYGPDGRRGITGLRRMSRPGRRVYRKQTNIPRVLDGLGVAILSTSQGVLTDHQARRRGVGGEVLCFVY